MIWNFFKNREYKNVCLIEVSSKYGSEDNIHNRFCCFILQETFLEKRKYLIKDDTPEFDIARMHPIYLHNIFPWLNHCKELSEFLQYENVRMQIL